MCMCAVCEVKCAWVPQKEPKKFALFFLSGQICWEFVVFPECVLPLSAWSYCIKGYNIHQGCTYHQLRDMSYVPWWRQEAPHCIVCVDLLHSDWKWWPWWIAINAVKFTTRQAIWTSACASSASLKPDRHCMDSARILSQIGRPQSHCKISWLQFHSLISLMAPVKNNRLVCFGGCYL